jgi:transcriptional regulator with PAS, ATPase and Fis domain
LLLGETGVGKELFARAIHQTSGRATAPFVALNCGALSRDLLSSELFGYADGAFTGARRGGMPGKIEQADGGTLFLDEVGEMPLEIQPHLLRVLEDGRLVRLGDQHERQITLRLIAATNRDLQAEVASGRFRSDLYHRLCVSSVLIPPLRSRKEDIVDIIAHLDEQFARKYGKAGKRLGEGVMEALTRHDWPGNVRELRNVYEMLFALCEDECIDMAQLPPDLLAGNTLHGSQADISQHQVNRLDAVERQAIERAIAQSDGNLSGQLAAWASRAPLCTPSWQACAVLTKPCTKTSRQLAPLAAPAGTCCWQAWCRNSPKRCVVYTYHALSMLKLCTPPARLGAAKYRMARSRP